MGPNEVTKSAIVTPFLLPPNSDLTIDFLKSPSSCLFSTLPDEGLFLLDWRQFQRPKNGSLRFNQSEVPWISLGDRLVKLCSTKRDLRLKQQLQDVLELTDIWKSARDSQQLSPHFSSTEKQFKMLLHWKNSLCRALPVEVDHHTLRTALVCCCKFLRQYMYFLRTLSRLSWDQWTLNDAKLSLTSRIFRTMVSFLSTQFRHKMFVKSEPSPRHWIYISFPVINSRFKQALVFFGHPISSIFVQDFCS